MSQKPSAKHSNTGIDFTPTIHNDTYSFIDPTQFDLEGRSVLVTGASKGIGKDAAISFAKAGASYIAIAARGNLAEVETEMLQAAQDAGRPEPEVLQLHLDVASEDSVSEAAEKIEHAFGRLDILINNAGYMENFHRMHESDPHTWWHCWEVNLKGVYLVIHALLPLLLKTPDSLRTILNVASISANKALAGSSAYGTSKLALLRLGEILNEDYADEGLITLAIHPGAVVTELANEMPDYLRQNLIDQPKLAADSMVWLTAQRREWLKGRYVSVTWDMKELSDMRPKIEESGLLKVRMDVGLD